MEEGESMKRAKLWNIISIILVLIIWQVIGMMGLVPEFMLPTPLDVAKVFVEDWRVLFENLTVTLAEAAIGMILSLLGSFTLAVMMDKFKLLHDMFYPICVVSQSIPTVAIAPLLVLWLGFGMTPKIVLVFLTCFFPLLVSLVSGFAGADRNVLRLYRSMNAGYWRVLFDVKIPYALESFFAGLKISAAYSVVGAVIAEWLGGDGGLGVYMTRVRKSFRFDKMFAVIIVISVLSLVLMKAVEIIRDKAMPWKRFEKN